MEPLNYYLYFIPHDIILHSYYTSYNSNSHKYTHTTHTIYSPACCIVALDTIKGNNVTNVGWCLIAMYCSFSENIYGLGMLLVVPILGLIYFLLLWLATVNAHVYYIFLLYLFNTPLPCPHRCYFLTLSHVTKHYLCNYFFSLFNNDGLNKFYRVPLLLYSLSYM